MWAKEHKVDNRCVAIVWSLSGQERTSDRTHCPINVRVEIGHSRCSAIFLQSAEVGISESDSKSTAYKNRTKSAKCGGLETNAPREKISRPDGCAAVRRFVREARGYWRFENGKIQQRDFAAEELAEREELGSNGLLSWSVQSSTWKGDRDLTSALKRQPNSPRESWHITRTSSVSFRKTLGCTQRPIRFRRMSGTPARAAEAGPCSARKKFGLRTALRAPAEAPQKARSLHARPPPRSWPQYDDCAV
jgi:hypothetical protein